LSHTEPTGIAEKKNFFIKSKEISSVNSVTLATLSLPRGSRREEKNRTVSHRGRRGTENERRLGGQEAKKLEGKEFYGLPASQPEQLPSYLFGL
jgi:hypothetical protein